VGLKCTLSDHHLVRAVDLPGHGDATGPFTLPRARESVRATIDEAGGTAHVVGISGGAVVALLTYLEHPARVSSLVLSGGLARAPRWFALQRAIGRITPEPLLARMLEGSYSGKRPEHKPPRRRGFSALRQTHCMAELSGLVPGLRLSRVTAPTLVLCGSNDRANIAVSKELAAGMPAANIEDAGPAEPIASVTAMRPPSRRWFDRSTRPLSTKGGL
jgi:3-oxoadipate enol-lactonase